MAGDRQGHYGPWAVAGDALDNLDVQLLDQGAAVEIVWSGGNGPHRGRVVFDHRSEPYYVSEQTWQEASGTDDPTAAMATRRPGVPDTGSCARGK